MTFLGNPRKTGAASGSPTDALAGNWIPNQLASEPFALRRLRIGIAVLAFLVYISIPTKNYYWDGISFAQAIESAPHWTALFHPNHLVYNLMGRSGYEVLGGSVRALYVLQVLNAIFAALTVYVVSGICAGLTQSRWTAILLSAAFAFSGTWWRFATDADAYILSVLLLTVCASLLLLHDDPNPLTVAFLHTGAMLIHELAFLFVPAALYVFWKKRRSDAMVYCGTAGITTLAVYFWAFHMQTGLWRASDFVAWTTSHANDVSFSFRIWRDLAMSIRSWAQLFFVGRPSIVQYANPLTILLLALFAGIFILFVVQISQSRKPKRGPRTVAFEFALIWLAAYAAFLLVWLPNNTFYKLFALPPVIIAIAASWRPAKPELSWRNPAVLGVALMALFNLTFAIIPYSRETANPAIQFALSLRQPLKNNAVVYFKDFNTDDWFARYFTPSADWKPVGATTVIDAELQNGKAVWLETTALDLFTATDPKWLNRRLRGAEWHELVNAKHRIRFVRLTPDRT